MTSSTVSVKLPVNPYFIHISSNGWTGIPEIFQKVLKGRKLMVVSDENVHAIYWNELELHLRKAGYCVYTAVIPPGESSKTLEMAEFLYTQALKSGLDRESAIVALGGGVVGDLAGFVASTYMRGISFVQIPTTLLAQVDSSVGGKVAVNHPLAKNIIGSFYQPRLVYINTNTLSTLPSREFSTGMAEVIKYGFIRDRELLIWLEENLDSLFGGNQETLVKAIEWCCQIKADVVQQDEKEIGLRAILNFGHTIGHAIESITGYRVYTHGEAVALGMIYESQIAFQMGLVDSNVITRLTTLLDRAGLPTSLTEPLQVEQLIEAMGRDKKNVGNTTVFILPTGIGEVNVFKNIDMELVKTTLNQCLNIK